MKNAHDMFASVAIDLGGITANLADMESMDLSSGDSFAQHMKANYPTGADGMNAYNEPGMVDVDVQGINAKLGRLESVDLDDDFDGNIFMIKNVTSKMHKL